jgi:putative transposase
MPVAACKQWVSVRDPLVLTWQCDLVGITWSTVYVPHAAAKPDEQEWALLAAIDAEYTRYPLYGSRKMRHYLRGVGHKIHRTRVQRWMGTVGLAGMAPGSNTNRSVPAAPGISVFAQGRGGDTAQ